MARKIADALPKPNTPGAQNYFVGVPNETHEYRMAIRGDQKLSGNDQMFGRYQVSKQSTPSLSVFTGTILSTDSNTVQEDYGWVFNETHTFTPSLVNVARFGRTEDDYTNILTLAGQDINSQIGLKGIPIQGNGLTGGLTGVTFSNSSFRAWAARAPRAATAPSTSFPTWLRGATGVTW